MLRMLWHFLASFLPGAGCQSPREGAGHDVRGTPDPAQGEQVVSSFLGKPEGRAEETVEKRPTILLVVGPAEQFPKVIVTSGDLPAQPSAGCGPSGGGGGVILKKITVVSQFRAKC